MPAKAKLTTRERTTSNVSSDNLNKGSELSHAEADSNFINLRDQTIAISDGSTSTDIEAGETITFSGASVSGNTVTVPTGAGMTIVGDDSSGTLINGGETLKIAGGTNVTTAMSGEVNGTTMSPVTTNADLNLTANGTGVVDVVNSKFSTATATISSISTTMNTIDGGSSSGPSRLLLRATGGTDAVAGRDKNAIHFESHSGNFNFQKTGGSTANITTEIGSSMALKVSALEGGNTNAGGFTIDGNDNAAITFNQKVDMNNFNMENVNQFDASHVTANRLTVSGVEGSVTFNDNKIATGQTNSNLELDANGTGDIKLLTKEIFIGDTSTDSAIISTETDRHLYLAQNMNLDSDFSSNAGGFIQIASNGTLILRPANGNQYIYNESSTVYIGRSSNAASMLSGLGRSATTLTTNAYSNGWEPRILFTPPGSTSSSAHKAESAITLDAGDTGSGTISLTTIKILMTRLPTSDPTTAGQLWNDSGTLKISAG